MFDLGPIFAVEHLIPHGLTDRSTGTVYYLRYDPASERLALNTELATHPARFTIRTFAAREEPWLGESGVRLFVEDGRLCFEYGEGDQGPRGMVASDDWTSDIVAATELTRAGDLIEHIQYAV